MSREWPCKCGEVFATKQRMRDHRSADCPQVAAVKDEVAALREARLEAGLRAGFSASVIEDVVPWREVARVAERMKRAF